MKAIITGAFTLLTLAAAAQQQFTIEGKVGTLNAPAKAYLNYRDTSGNVIRDSADVSNGHFTFKGNATEIVDANLILMHKGETMERNQSVDRVFVMLEKGTIQVNAADSLVHATVTGTPANADFAALSKVKQPFQDKIAALRKTYAEYQAEGNKDFDKTYGAELTAANDGFEKTDFDFIKTHPDSYISLLILQVYLTSKPITKTIEPYFQSFPALTRNSRVGKLVAANIEKYKRVDINAPAPDFTLADTTGANFTLSSFKGKYVLVDFWASWCKPCRAENPNVVKAFNAYKNKNFAVVGVSLDYPDAKAKWLKAITEDHLEQFTQVADMKDINNEAATLYNVTSIPQNFLLGPDGKIIAKNLRGDELQEKLASLLN